MKKLLFTTVAILMLGMFNQASAQFGVRAGLNLANLSTNDDDTDLESKTGFHVGVFYEHMLNESLYIRPGALFSTKGAQISEDFGGTTFTSSGSFKYIEVPIDIVYKIPAGSNSFNINAGPYIGLLMSAKSKFDDGTNTEEDDIKDETKGIDFGINIGVEYQFGQIGIGAGYGLGLTNIQDFEGSEDTAKNTNLNFYVAYRF